jgi:prepilin peptidase CpaA
MILFLACLLGVLFPAVIALLAAWDDMRHLHIANAHPLVLAIGFPFIVMMIPYISFFSGLLAAVVVLLPGLLLFALRVFGAGDIKLATVMALYLGVGALGRFVLGACLMGGILAVVAVCVRRYATPLLSDVPPRHWLDRIRQGGRDVPYGVALAVPFIVLLTERFMHAYDFLNRG